MGKSEPKKLKRVLRLIWSKKFIKYPSLLAGTLIFLFLLLLLLDRVIMPILVHWGELAVVPDLTELSLREAKAISQKKGLNLRVMAEVHDATKPPGTVLSQIPPPNTKVREGRIIKVTVSKGGKTVLVPKLKGVSIRQAELLLAHEGLELGEVTWSPSDSFPKDVVLFSTPSTGTSVPYGMFVNLEVSLGPKPDTVKMPDLVGMNLEEGKKLLREMGLELGKMKYSINDEFPPGTILRQSLDPGEKIERGSKINLEVSTTE